MRVTAEEARELPDRTDDAALDAMTDEDITKGVAEDPDAVPLDIDWKSTRLVLPPGKRSVTLRIDNDVMDWFRKQGRGYQTRINTILRTYKEAHTTEEETKMLVSRETQQQIIELVTTDPQQKSWQIIKELRKRGSQIPERRVVQLIRSTAILCNKSRSDMK